MEAVGRDPGSRCLSALVSDTRLCLVPSSQASNRDAITKSFTFKDFNEAFAFMTCTALKAEVVRTLSCLPPRPDPVRLPDARTAPLLA